MSQKKIKMPKSDIDFTIEGVDGPVNYSLSPMIQKIAANVYHNCLGKVIASIAKAVTGKDKREQMAQFVAAIPTIVTFDEVWFILEQMMKNAMVDDVEIGSLEESGIFDENPHHMYLILFHGIRGNWPKTFLKLEAKLGGFASKLKKTMKDMEQMGTEDGEEETKN